MESNRYKLLKIPFVSKKTANIITDGAFGYESKYAFDGVAYYIIDTETMCIIWERAKLNNSEYRPTDNAMLKPTEYYVNLTKKGFDREKVLPRSNNSIEEASQEQLDIINEFSFTKLNTVLNIEGVITGSNPSGADKTPSAAPIIFNPKLGVDYIRFVNAIKRVRCHEPYFARAISENFNSLEELEKHFTEIDINTFKKLNKKFSDWIGIINSDIDEAEENDVMSYISEVSSKFQYKSIDYLLALKEKDLIDDTKLVQKLRREFRINLLKEAKELNVSEFTGKNINILDAEAAHILDVSIIIKNNLNYKWISDPNNGLLLEPTLHTILDKNKITINEDGYIIAIDESYKYLSNLKIIDDVMNQQRIAFINLKREKIN